MRAYSHSVAPSTCSYYLIQMYRLSFAEVICLECDLAPRPCGLGKVLVWTAKSRSTEWALDLISRMKL